MRFSSRVFLSPMARITDVAFRGLCTRYGAGMTVTELINAKGLIKNFQRHDLRRADNEKHFSVQLFGDNQKDLSKAAQLVENHCDSIDLNLGCPAYKICRVGAGSQLLSHPQKVFDIVSSMVKSVSIPITVKMRTGINKDNITVFDVAKRCQDAGASLVAIHGRTRDQGYSGSADWEVIKQVKDCLDIPVVGNGDITSPELAREKLRLTDFVSIGRAASGNPLLFTQCNDFLQTKSYKKYSVSDKLTVFDKYLSLCKEYDIPILHQKLQAQHFTKGLDNGSKIRLAINDAKNSQELSTIMQTFINKD